MKLKKLPEKSGLYDPAFEHDSCGIGFVVNVKGVRSNAIIRQAITVLKNLEHRGACGCEPNTGDGAGILFQKPHGFFADALGTEGITLPAQEDYGVGMMFLSPDPSVEEKTKKNSRI